MEWVGLSGLFKLIAALSFVVGLMFLLTFILKKLGLAQSQIRGSNARLKIVESLPLDPRRQAVLLQCDDKQHLVICSANGETLIESGIEPVQSDDDDT